MTTTTRTWTDDEILSEKLRLLDPNWLSWAFSAPKPLINVPGPLPYRIRCLVARIRKNLAIRMTDTAKG